VEPEDPEDPDEPEDPPDDDPDCVPGGGAPPPLLLLHPKEIIMDRTRERAIKARKQDGIRMDIFSPGEMADTGDAANKKTEANGA
jgi:hypothetical protein